MVQDLSGGHQVNMTREDSHDNIQNAVFSFVQVHRLKLLLVFHKADTL